MSQDLWHDVSRRLRATVSPQEYSTWFEPLDLWVEGNWAVLVVPNHFFAEWIKERYRQVVHQALIQTLGRQVDVIFQLGGEGEGPHPLKQSSPKPLALGQPEEEAAQQGDQAFNHRYTFDNFVVGPCNELASAACQAVASDPGRQYNPLLLFGGAGLGKTHLIVAVGNRIRTLYPNFHIHYCSCEEFTNELLEAVRFDGITAFRDKYRQVDCLLLDDIQFLAGRDRTQEELFHTFNALFEQGKQIILSSDQMPRDIQGLEKRLCTRFEWGLMADLQPPDEETMVAILQKKAAERGLLISNEVARFLAAQPQSNVRVLEGFLTRVMAVSRFQGVEVSLDLVRRVVGPLVGERQVSVEDVIRTVAANFGVKPSDLKSSRKSREISRPRQVAMYLSRRLTEASFPEIGRAFGNKDHSTVVKGAKKLSEQLTEDPDLAERVRTLERMLREQGPPAEAADAT